MKEWIAKEVSNNNYSSIANQVHEKTKWNGYSK